MAGDKTITGILRTAQEAVDDAQLAEAFRVTGFEKAVDLLAVQAGLVPAVSASLPLPPNGSGSSSAGSTPPNDADAKTLARVAAKLKVSTDAVGEVFHIEDDRPILIIGTGKLESGKGPATKQIALLISAARQAGGWDSDWTSVTEVRPVAQNYGKFDSGNFASTIKEMDDVFNFTGDGQSRKIKVNRKGLEEAAALVKKLAGEE
jgi:hypothetical protein